MGGWVGGWVGGGETDLCNPLLLEVMGEDSTKDRRPYTASEDPEGHDGALDDAWGEVCVCVGGWVEENEAV